MHYNLERYNNSEDRLLGQFQACLKFVFTSSLAPAKMLEGLWEGYTSWYVYDFILQTPTSSCKDQSINYDWSFTFNDSIYSPQLKHLLGHFLREMPPATMLFCDAIIVCSIHNHYANECCEASQFLHNFIMESNVFKLFQWRCSNL